MEFDMADVKPSVMSFVIVTLMAIIGISLAKFIVTKWPIPGVTEVVQAV